MNLTGRRAALVANGILTTCLAVATVVTWQRGSDDKRQTTPVVSAGQALFTAKGCAGCHVGPGGIGQGNINLTVGLTSRVPGLSRSDYVRQSITNPGAVTIGGAGSGYGSMPRLSPRSTQ